jgi:prepilin-type N-terminal cleavage/methylation domain-containing protein
MPEKKRGFTLIEILTSLGLFLVVATISMGAIVSIFDANRKTQSLKTVMDNLNFTLESMSREIRFGTNYHCGAVGGFTTPRNCPVGSQTISFLSSDGLQIVYRKNGSQIEKSINGGSTYVAVTAPEITIRNLNIYVLGAGASNLAQPKVVITIQGNSGTKVTSQTDFSVQTTISQRLLDS